MRGMSANSPSLASVPEYQSYQKAVKLTEVPLGEGKQDAATEEKEETPKSGEALFTSEGQTESYNLVYTKQQDFSQ